VPFRHPWALLLVLSALVPATRLPLVPGPLLTFDDVNLAYSIGHFDVSVSQPQPPRYPLFVMEMRLLYRLHFRRAENILPGLGIAGSMVTMALLMRFGSLMLGQTGFWAARPKIFQPVFRQTGAASALRMQLAATPVAKFFGLIQQAFAPAAADPMYVTDLPQESGSRRIGEYKLVW
jgi:hypothetical protein